jgi:uncharacterized repeat protein (TIGR03803 family)
MNDKKLGKASHFQAHGRARLMAPARFLVLLPARRDSAIRNQGGSAVHSFQQAWFRGALLASIVALAVFANAAQAQAYNFRAVHRFAGGPADGNSPAAPVSFDAAGNLYGTTRFGGARGGGTIFKIAGNGTETIIHSFARDGGAGGSYPYAGVTVDSTTGDLYGTTTEGGSGCSSKGCGVLYKQAANGTFTVLHVFDGANDGSNPAGRLLRDAQGNLYGTALFDGPNGRGTVFRYGADGQFTVLHGFAGEDGANPDGGVISDSAGNLYGVTTMGGPDYQAGGLPGYGTVYELASDGAFSTLHAFTDGIDGTGPVDGLTGDQAGNLYGATQGGGLDGTVFKLSPEGLLTTLYHFTGVDSGVPNGDLLLIAGNLYGTASYGGDNDDCHHLYCGVAFKLEKDGTYTELHAFGGQGGADPLAGLAYRRGRLFGTTALEGGKKSAGSVYSIGVVQ